jgi:arylsulfatase A-like enzyme
MTPLKNSLQKRTVRETLLHERARNHVTRLLIYGLFCAAIAAIRPATASAEVKTIANAHAEMGYATSQLDKKHFVSRNGGNYRYGYRETPPSGYYGNWGYAPGGYYWDRNYLWRRSLGFWDTNSPACPFRSC